MIIVEQPGGKFHARPSTHYCRAHLWLKTFPSDNLAITIAPHLTIVMGLNPPGHEMFFFIHRRAHLSQQDDARG